MKVEELIVYGKGFTHSDYVKILLAELLNLNPLELLNHLQDEVKEDIATIYKKEIAALKAGEPLQYVIGNVNFYGLKFYIDKRVLIPRFETEELVEHTINFIKEFFTKPVDIIDLGCGSGVIGLTLEKKVSTSSVDLVDISTAALEVTHKNCVNLNSNANIIHSDMLEKIVNKYDVIISNPPYIKENEEIEEIVKENEPHLALYAGVDGLDCYKKIIQKLPFHMKDRCLVAFEIGMTQAQNIKNLVKEYIPDTKVIVKQDLSGKDRMLFILKNLE